MITSVPFEEATPKAPTEAEKPKQSQEELEQINKFCLDGFNKMQSKDKLKEYLASRKLNEDAINKYHLFISKDLVKDKEFLVIPSALSAKKKVNSSVLQKNSVLSP